MVALTGEELLAWTDKTGEVKTVTLTSVPIAIVSKK